MQPDPINGLVTNLTLPIKCFCNYLSPLYEGQNIQAALKRSKPMSILKKLRERTDPLNVSELAQLLAVTEGTVPKRLRLRSESVA
jgi:hypothetical protein